MEPSPAIIAPLDDHMGLDIARSLARQGIPVYGVDSDPRVAGRHSRCCRFVLAPDLERDGEKPYVAFLERLGRDLGRRAVLYPLSDAHVLVASRHRGVLQKHFDYVMPAHHILESLLTKHGLYGVAREVGIPAPETALIGSEHELTAIARHIAFPAILKPTESPRWHDPEVARLLRRGVLAARAKVLLCHTPADLLGAYRLVSTHDRNLIVQEVIPGQDDRLAYVAFCLDRDSRPLGIFAGRKHRVLPIGFGSASYVRSCRDADLVALGLELLMAVRYQGLAGVEFKMDSRDGHYKLIEVNTRFGMWDGLSVRCGVDLPYIAYRDALRLPVEPAFDYREGVIWVDWQRDVRAALAYWQAGQLSPRQWLHSLHGEKMWAIYSWHDWRPGLAFTLSLAGRLGQRLLAAAWPGRRASDRRAVDRPPAPRSARPRRTGGPGSL